MDLKNVEEILVFWTVTFAEFNFSLLLFFRVHYEEHLQVRVFHMWRESAQKFAVASKLKRQATLQCIFVEYCVSVSAPSPFPLCIRAQETV